MSRPQTQRVRQALAQGKRDIQQIMEITGAAKTTCFAERAAWLRRTGETRPVRESLNDRIRACIAAGMTDAYAIQADTGAARRNHIYRLLKEARAKA